VFDEEVAHWIEVSRPPRVNAEERRQWELAGGNSEFEWAVQRKGAVVSARLLRDGEAYANGHAGLNFVPTAGRLRKISAVAAVKDGWLVGFNHGEFGGALYWFSPDGSNRYMISSGNIVDVFNLNHEYFAIGGLDHGSYSRGEIIQISQLADQEKWQGSPLIKLPSAPYAVSVFNSESAIITLSNGVVLYKDGKLSIIIPDGPWEYFFPQNSVLSDDQKKLYIGMRQYVAEIDLEQKALRLLVPSEEFKQPIDHN
jgi:hypothetical protein